LLDGSGFENVADAQRQLDALCSVYDEVRPHQSLDGMTPAHLPTTVAVCTVTDRGGLTYPMIYISGYTSLPIPLFEPEIANESHSPETKALWQTM